MKSRIQILLVLCVFAICTTANAQDEKTVTLVVSGQGITQDEAKQNALRSAIEQAFGAFISSKTEILNDNLVKDEIVSVANGNIQKFEIISEVQIPNGVYATTLKATVSVTKLTSFVESKGVVVEFKGSLFAFNVFNQQLSEKNEITALENLKNILSQLPDRSFDYTISMEEPRSESGDNSKFLIPLKITCKANDNLRQWVELFESTIKQLAMISGEVINYRAIQKSTFSFEIVEKYDIYGEIKASKILHFRNQRSLEILNEIFAYIVHGIQNFEIKNGQKTFDLYSFQSRERSWYTSNEQSEIQQKQKNYLMIEFNYHSLFRSGPNIFDGCYPCLYSRDLFYLMNRGPANRTTSMKNEISFNEISKLVGQTVAIYEISDKLSIDEIKFISKYTVGTKIN